jgi:hypothetical protein
MTLGDFKREDTYMHMAWKQWGAVIAVALVVGAGRADLVLSDFNNVGLDGVYASWSTGTITTGATAMTVSATFFGGGFDTFAATDVSAYDTIELDVTVNLDTAPTVLSILQDGDGTLYAYRWFGLALGNHVLVMPLTPVPNLIPGYGDSFEAAAGTTAGLDLTTINAFQLQIDNLDTYDVSFNNLAVVPEPASVVLMMIGGLGLAAHRRRPPAF